MTAAPRLHLRLRFEPGAAASLEPVAVEGAGYEAVVEPADGQLRNRRTPLDTILTIKFGYGAPVDLPASTRSAAQAARIAVRAWASAWNDHARRVGTVDRDLMVRSARDLAAALRVPFSDHDVSVEAYCDAMGGVL